jgi:hypothetical protein
MSRQGIGPAETQALLARVEDLFQGFDRAADPVLDELVESGDSQAMTALATGLALRLVELMMAQQVLPADTDRMAASLVLELSTLRANIKGHAQNGSNGGTRQS